MTEFLTPSGHKVYLKPHLTHGDKRDIQRVFAKATTVDPKTEEITFDSSSIYDAQDLALRRMIVRMVLADGSTVEGGDSSLATILSWQDEADAKAIYDRIEELTSVTNLTAEQKTPDPRPLPAPPHRLRPHPRGLRGHLSLHPT